MTNWWKVTAGIWFASGVLWLFGDNSARATASMAAACLFAIIAYGERRK